MEVGGKIPIEKYVPVEVGVAAEPSVVLELVSEPRVVIAQAGGRVRAVRRRGGVLRVARARAREGAARSRKIFARFHFLHILLACARDARARAGKRSKFVENF